MPRSSSVLYFPYVNVPQDGWFTRILLYWDQVGAIVPHAYADDAARFTPYTRELVAAGLVARVVPEEHEGALLGPMDRFLAAVDADADVARRRGRPLGIEPARRGGVEEGTVFEIHSGKLGDLVARALVARGLARRAQGARGQWYQVESFVAARFMAFLAGTLAARTDMWPITDTAYSLTGFGAHPGDDDETRAIVESLRPAVLDAVLPAPSDAVAVAELVSFKEQHAAALARLRDYVDHSLIGIAAEPSAWARSRLQDELVREAAEQVDEIVARMAERRWKRIVKGAVLAAPPLATLGLAAADPTGASIVSAVASFPAALMGARAELRPDRSWEKEPLAYAALAERRFAG